MRDMDFHRAAALGERPKRAGHDRTTQKHHADERSRTRRRIQAMTPVPRREDHRLRPSRYSKSLAAPPASPRRRCSMVCGHDGLRWRKSRGLKPGNTAWRRGHGSQPARRRDICLARLLHAIERPVTREAKLLQELCNCNGTRAVTRNT